MTISRHDYYEYHESKESLMREDSEVRQEAADIEGELEENEAEDNVRTYKRIKYKEFITLDGLFDMWEKSPMNGAYNFGNFCRLMGHLYRIY